MFKFENINKTYGKNIVALKDVSFTSKDGEFIFIVGHSGAGKSTLIRLLIRQEFPTKGNIFFEDLDITKIPRSMLSIYRQQLGIVFQDLKLLPAKTVKENISFALEITDKNKKEIQETTEYLLDVVNLNDRSHLFPAALSGGEKQKVAIARALANEPKLLIADEPTGNIDPETSIEILEILKAINSWGTTVMVVTHDHDIVDSLQTRVIRLEKGEVVADEKGGYISK